MSDGVVSTTCPTCGSAMLGGASARCATTHSAIATTPVAGPVAAAADAEGWASALRDIFPREENGVFSVARQFASTPVRAILGLTGNPAYRGQWKFLLACLSAMPILQLLILPRIGNALANLPVTATKADVFALQLAIETLQIAGVLILSPLQYYACRAIGTIDRTPRSYFKLCVLSVSYCTMLTIAAWSIAYLIAMALLVGNAPLDGNKLIMVEDWALRLGIVAYVAIVHRQFWGMTWLKAIAVTIAIAVVSWVVVYPALNAIENALHLPELFRHMMG